MADKLISLRLYEINTRAGSGSVTALLLPGGKKANVCVKPPTDPQETAIRLYRRGGSLPDNHFHVGEFPISTLSGGGCAAGSLQIVDNVADTALGPAVELDNDMPVSSVTVENQPLPVIFGPFDERVLGTGDPARPNVVYFSKRLNPDSWPPQNWVSVSSPGDPVQNGVVYNTRCFVFSKERLHELVPNIIPGLTFASFPTPCGRGLASPWALTSADRIYFVSKDGVYATTGGREESLVEDSIKPLFPTQEGPGRSVNGLEAVDMTLVNSMRLAWHNGELWFLYQGADTGVRQMLIYDTERKRWRAARHTPAVVTVYSEPATVSSLLLTGLDVSGLPADAVTLFRTGGDVDHSGPIQVTIRTGAHDQGQPLNLKEYGNILFDLDPGGADVANPVTITPFINGDAAPQAAITVTGSGRQTVPLSLGDIEAFNVSFEFSWSKRADINPVLFQYEILYRPKPARLKHWQTEPTNFGLAGYLHLRDLYVTLISSADITLTVNFDGTTQSYTIPSTSGLKRKQYVAMKSNKGKLYSFKLESTGEYRVFAQESECRVKQWLTNLGYANTKPFGLEVGQ